MKLKDLEKIIINTLTIVGIGAIIVALVKYFNKDTYEDYLNNKESDEV